MAKCMECMYAKPAGVGIYKCSKKGRTFEFPKTDPSACSSFRSDEDTANSCYACDYFRNGIFSPHCKKTGDKINEDDRACRHFRYA